MPKRRVKLLYIHPDLFTQLCPGGKAIVLDSDIPKDARRISTFYCERDDRLGFIMRTRCRAVGLSSAVCVATA